NGLLRVGSPRPKFWHTVDRGGGEVKPVELIEHAHVEWRRGGALFLVAAHVKVPVALAAIGQPVNKPGIAMEREDDRLVDGEQRVKILIREPMRVLAPGLQLPQL